MPHGLYTCDMFAVDYGCICFSCNMLCISIVSSPCPIPICEDPDLAPTATLWKHFQKAYRTPH